MSPQCVDGYMTFIVKLLPSNTLVSLRMCGILSRKGCDNY